MTTLVLERQPRAVRVEPVGEHIAVTLDDGRILSVPVEWYPRLANASEAERRNCEVFGNGTAIEWPDIDEHVSVEGLIAGRRSGESQRSFERWLQSRGKAPTP